MEAKDILVALSLKYEGDYEKMLSDIRKKVPLTKEEKERGQRETKSMVVSIVDSDYPSCFRSCYQPPLLLYYYGNLSLLEKPYRLTAIGTRHPSVYQSETCYSLLSQAEERMKDKMIVVSGMAIGLDQQCMLAAMDRGAPVVSVIGSGIDKPFPSENQGLYEYCKSGKGLVLSEYPIHCSAKPENFLFRNRLLAGISNVLFVGGGKSHSGTSVTVRYALEEGKDVLALPCNIGGDDLTNSLIKDGASPVLDTNDILEALFSAYGIDEEMKRVLSTSKKSA